MTLVTECNIINKVLACSFVTMCVFGRHCFEQLSDFMSCNKLSTSLLRVHVYVYFDIFRPSRKHRGTCGSIMIAWILNSKIPLLI